MQNLSDSDLDKLFRDAAEGHRPEFDPEGWKAMAARLGQAGTPYSFWNWKSISVITGTAFVSVSIWLWISGNEADHTKTSPQKSEAQQLNSRPDIHADKSSDQEAQLHLSGPANADEGHPIISKSEVAESDAGLINQQADVVDKWEYQANTTIPISQTVENESEVNVQDESKVTIVVPKLNTGILNKNQIAQQSVLTDTISIVIEEKKDDDEEKEEGEKIEIEDKENKAIRTGRWAVKLSVAPDYSTVNSTRPEQLGLNYGALVEFRFNTHWSVAAGGIWAKKIYTAYDVEYWGYSADWVEGECRMWDIPVNMYYNFTPGRAFSFYGSVGLSSYIMNKETYMSYVETSNGVLNFPWGVEGENNEWFKMLNVSLGVQANLSNHFSIQLEPFMKAPLAGVGEGDVSLASFGAFFNVKYIFFKQ